MSAGALPGFRDFYPTELAERNYLFGVWRDVARRFGFVEYDGPPLEPLELYTKKSGDEIVGQLYSFEDKGGRGVALRPEMTPTFARMVAARANSLARPIRWFSIPQLFRYERQQRGRLREHFQLNVDIVGESDVVADAELLALAIEVVRSTGLTADDVVARVSDRRLLTALIRAWGVPDDQVPAAFAAIDKMKREPRVMLAQSLSGAGLSVDAATQLLEQVGSFDINRASFFYNDPEVKEAIDRLQRYLTLLDAHGVSDWVQFDLSIVRGLAYYTGIVFEMFDRKGDFRAICGGGRYDTLLQSLGGVDLPALGFGMGDVVLGEILRTYKKFPLDLTTPSVDYWIGTSEPLYLNSVIHIASTLRHDWKQQVLCTTKATTISKQKSLANRAGAKKFLFVYDAGVCSLDGMDVEFNAHFQIHPFLKGDGTYFDASGSQQVLKPDATLPGPKRVKPNGA